jgi:hypothetical protein
LQFARENPETWFSQVLDVDDTHAVSLEAIEEERRAGMPEEMIQQEFYCSFQAPLVGSYYGDLITKMENEDPPRIGNVPWDPAMPVDTFWDLGIGDSTAIWFHQNLGPERRLIRYEECEGVGVDYYATLLQAQPYTYRRHYVPHDAMSKTLQTGRSLVDRLRDLGIKSYVVDKTSLETGIMAVRAMLPMTWIDAEHCERGVQALREYKKRTIPNVLDPDGNPVYSKEAVHSWASNGADALRMGAVAWKAARSSRPPLKRKMSVV